MYCYQRSELSLENEELPNIIRSGWKRSCRWNGLSLGYRLGRYEATPESLEKIGLDGLRVMVTWGETSKLQISNSPHKVMQGGTNHKDFHLSEMSDYIRLVSERLGISYWDAKPVGRFEFAVNLVEPMPNEFINDLASHKLRPLDEMKDKGRSYGKRSRIFSLMPKIYNPYLKDKYSSERNPNFQENLIRCECVSSISYLQKRGICINSVQDLCNQEIVKSLGNLLSKTMEHITFKANLLKHNMRDVGIYRLFTHASKEELAYYRRMQKNTFYRQLKIYKKLVEQNAIRTNDLPERVVEKWTKLSAS